MIEDTVARWHQHLRERSPGGLDDLLADDCTFFSPIVFSPQRGRELTAAYLSAAFGTFGGEPAAAADADAAGTGTGGFRYVKEVVSGNHAVLEFETTMGDTVVNGVDIITCDDEGRIVEFKVMIRPLRAVNVVHERMRTMLEAIAAAAPDAATGPT